MVPIDQFRVAGRLPPGGTGRGRQAGRQAAGRQAAGRQRAGRHPGIDHEMCHPEKNRLQCTTMPNASDSDSSESNTHKKLEA